MKKTTHTKSLLLTGLLSVFSLPAVAAEQPAANWKFEGTLYALGAGMSGDMTVKGITADLNMGFDDILSNLEFGMMGSFRASKGAWAVTTDVVYMGLGASKNNVTADMDQWCVEPTVSYRLSDGFEVLAGVRYNSLSGEIIRTGVSPTPRQVIGTQDWFDPIIGFNYRMPINPSWSFNLRADVGGISGLTWQAFPTFAWNFSDTGLMHMGYRWISNDYSTGSGTSQFSYNMMTEGPQVGVTFRF